jgi:hypothetical protein
LLAAAALNSAKRTFPRISHTAVLLPLARNAIDVVTAGTTQPWKGRYTSEHAVRTTEVDLQALPTGWAIFNAEITTDLVAQMIDTDSGFAILRSKTGITKTRSRATVGKTLAFTFLDCIYKNVFDGQVNHDIRHHKVLFNLCTRSPVRHRVKSFY